MTRGWQASTACLLVFCLLFFAPKVVQAAEPGEEFVAGQLLVGYRKISDINRLLPIEGVIGIIWNSNLLKLGTALIDVEPGREMELMERIRTEPGIRFVEVNYLVEPALAPTDPLWGQQYGPIQVGAEAAWDITTGSSDVILAIIDSGIDATHPEFSGRIVPGYDFIDNDKTPNDRCGHGTHVAGIAAAAGNNGRGIAGMAWFVKIMPLRVLGGPGDPFGPCGGSTASVADAIVWATNHGAKVINLSIGTSAPSSLMENATYYAYRNGVALFAAAGNAGTSPVFYPAAYPWVMAVGATDSSNLRASYSNTGSGLDIMAPGTHILSTTPRGYFYYSEPSSFGLLKEYDFLSGTSMAAPFVSGAAALLAGQPAYDTPERVYEALIETTLDMDSVGRDDQTGYGLLQIGDALTYLPLSPPPSPPVVPLTQYDILDTKACPNLVSYSWQNAHLGSPLPVFGNNGSFTTSLPFVFTYGETDYTSVTVSANGFMTFAAGGGAFDNFLIPGIAQPNNFIAPFWDDLNPSAGGQVYTETFGISPDRQYVVEWRNVPINGISGALDFQVILHETSGEITFQYKRLSGSRSHGSSATVGLEFADGYAGTEYSYNQGVLFEGLAIRFVPYVSTPRPSDGCIPAVVTTGSVNEKENFDLALTEKVGESGGFFMLSSYCAKIPPDLVRQDSTLIMRIDHEMPQLPEGWVSLGPALEIELSPRPDFSLVAPGLCYKLKSDSLLLSGGSPGNIFFAYFDPSLKSWVPLSTSYDAASDSITTFPPHFSLFGVFTARPQTLPATGASFAGYMLVGPIGLAVSIFVLHKRQFSMSTLERVKMAAFFCLLTIAAPNLPTLFSYKAIKSEVLSTTNRYSSDGAKQTALLAREEFGSRLIEKLVIPSLGISPSVSSTGWTVNLGTNGLVETEWQLDPASVSWVLTSSLPDETGNIVLFGHNNIGAAVFSNLIDLQIGDPIYLLTGNGLYGYRTSEIHLIKVDELSAAEYEGYVNLLGHSDSSVLTLVSCWPYLSSTHRLIVRAQRLSWEP